MAPAAGRDASQDGMHGRIRRLRLGPAVAVLLLVSRVGSAVGYAERDEAATG